MEYSKRAVFPKRKQKEFLKFIKSKLGLSTKALVRRIGANSRSYSDWQREKYSVPLNILKHLCESAEVILPKNIIVKDPFWYTSTGARAGALAVLKKYGRIGGEENYRKKKWYEWWEKTGKYRNNPYFRTKEIQRPSRNMKLAEFVGIMMGDGGITKRQITITLNCYTDREYIEYVGKLLESLFHVTPAMCLKEKDSIMNIIISRTELVKFCKSVGLKIGNKLKQDLDIPAWISRKKEYQKACIRGLVDTDGCLFYEQHKIKNKLYRYPRLNFTSASPSLIQSVFNRLRNFNLNPKIRRNNGSVQIENKENIDKYFQIIGTSNPKHKHRYGGVG